MSLKENLDQLTTTKYSSATTNKMEEDERRIMKKEVRSEPRKDQSRGGVKQIGLFATRGRPKVADARTPGLRRR